MQQRQTRRRWLFPIAGVLVAGGVAAGILLGASGIIRIGPRPSPSVSATPTLSLPDVLDRVESSAVTVESTTLDGILDGSGFVVAPGGIVLTNAHVIAHAYAITVIDRSGGHHKAEVVGLDDQNDVAALKVGGFGKPPLVLVTNSHAPKVGTELYIVGNPGGDHPNTVLQGLLSATGRDFSNDEGRDYHDLYQLDTSNVIPGNSGSAVIGADGGVVGMVALAEPGSASSPGRFGYAIPTSTFRQEVAAWARMPVPLAVSAADEPWQPDPSRAVVQLSELRAGYTVHSETPTYPSASPPGVDVTYALPASGTSPARQIFSRVIVETTRTDASALVQDEVTTYTDQGASEVQTATSLGDESHVLTQPVANGTTTVDVVWRDRNVFAELQIQGLAGDAAVTAALDLAADVEKRITAMPMTTAALETPKPSGSRELTSWGRRTAPRPVTPVV